MLKVFLVEDEAIIREGLRDIIPWQQYGYTLVGDAGDGEEALPMIRETRPDVLITDISQKQEKLSSICIKGKNFLAPGLPGAEGGIELEKLTTNNGLHLPCQKEKKEEENQRIPRFNPKYLLFFKTSGKK